MKQHSTGILTHLRDGEFDKAEFSAEQAQRFGTTISHDAYSGWLSLLREQLIQLLPYLSSADIPVKDSILRFKTENFATQLISAVSCVFRALECTHDYLDTSITLHTLIDTPLDAWIRLCDECLAGNELSLASRSCWFAIHCTTGEVGHPSNLDEARFKSLLELWFRRAHIFELQNAIDEAISAIEVYSRLFSEFQRQISIKEQSAALQTFADPISYQAHQRLLEKRRSRMRQ